MQTTKKGKLSYKTVVLAGGLVGGVFMSQTALATVHPGGSIKPLFSVSEVPDVELAGIRGKYVDKGREIYFGVELATSWVTTDNEHFSGNINLSLSGSNKRYVPTITYKVHKSDKGAKDVRKTFSIDSHGRKGGKIRPDKNQNVVIDDEKHKGAKHERQPISVGGLDKAEGIAQSIQIAGAANKVRNEISITIDKRSSDNIRAAGDSLLPRQDADSGVYVTHVLTGDKLALEFDVPGQGRVMQSISSKRGLKQQVQLTGNFNDVVNRMSIVVRLGELQGLNTSGVRNALANINSLHALGRF